MFGSFCATCAQKEVREERSLMQIVGVEEESDSTVSGYAYAEVAN